MLFKTQGPSSQLVETSIAGVCSYRDQNFSTTNDEKETDVPLIWPASFAPPRLIILAALSLQSNFFPKHDPRLISLAALSFDSNPRHMIQTSFNTYAPFDSNPCHMIQTFLHIWLHRFFFAGRFVLQCNCLFLFVFPCCSPGSRRLRSKHPFSFWVSLQPMRFELHWLRLVGTLFYLRKYVCRYVRTS